MSVSVVSIIRIIAMRDLRSVRREIEAYPDDRSLWCEAEGISNPGGTLALHLAGNLQHYVSAVLGRSTYVRDRDAEFSVRDIPKAEVLRRLDQAIESVDEAFRCLTDEDLEKPYPEPMGEIHLFTGQFLIHQLAHLCYHMGQIDYHRRLITKANTTINAQSVPQLVGIPD